MDFIKKNLKWIIGLGALVAGILIGFLVAPACSIEEHDSYEQLEATVSEYETMLVEYKNSNDELSALVESAQPYFKLTEEQKLKAAEEAEALEAERLAKEKADQEAKDAALTQVYETGGFEITITNILTNNNRGALQFEMSVKNTSNKENQLYVTSAEFIVDGKSYEKDYDLTKSPNELEPNISQDGVQVGMFLPTGVTIDDVNYVKIKIPTSEYKNDAIIEIDDLQLLIG